MKLKMKFEEDRATIRCRLVRTKSTTPRFYLARILGEDPQFSLSREFLDAKGNVLGDKLLLTYTIDHDGIFELYEKHLDRQGKLHSKTRLWLIIYKGKAALLSAWALDYPYVARCAEHIKRTRTEC